MMPESEFRAAVATTLDSLGRQLDAVDSDEVDWKLSDGVLTVEFEAGGVFVLSQQVPTRELWLSAFSRAWHFDRREGTWLERDSREPLAAVLTAGFSQKLGFPVPLTA